MSQAAPAQIVHESEAQRQHVRLKLPARATIAGQSYDVRDLSPGGMGVTGITGDYARGKILDISLSLPFGTFSLDVNLKGEVQHYNEAEKLLGCHFTTLTTEQLALINHVLKAFLAGDVVASGDILNVASRDSFTKERKQVSQAAAVPGFDIKKQIPGLTIMGLLGLMALYVIGGNIYDAAFVVKSTDAYVSAKIIDVTAPASGQFKILLTPGSSGVKTGQEIADITNASGNSIMRILSPCDCQVSGIEAQENEFVTAGTRVITLTPASAKPIVIATVNPEDSGRIKTDSKTLIIIAGTQREFSGRVSSMKSGLAEESVNQQPNFVPKPVFVTITPDQPLPADLANVPARVVFTTR